MLKLSFRVLRRWLFFGSAVALIWSADSSAGMRTSLLGVFDYSLPTGIMAGSPITGSVGGSAFGGGLTFELNLFRRLSFEVGALYYEQRFKDTSGTLVSYAVLDVPVNFRFWLSRLLFVSLGGYASFGIDGVTETSSAGVVATGVLADAALNNSIYGVFAGMGFNFPIARSVAFRLEGRYRYALSNFFSTGTVASDSTAFLRISDAQILAGLTIGGY
ncbi:hypothetical protein WDW37_05655 [Bdellovibrionota bacterium FG-1]